MSDVNLGYSKDIFIIPKLRLYAGNKSVTSNSNVQSFGINLELQNSPFKELKEYNVYTKWHNTQKVFIGNDKNEDFSCTGDTCSVTINDINTADIFNGGPKQLFGNTYTHFDVHLEVENAEPVVFSNLPLNIDYSVTLKVGNDTIFGRNQISNKSYILGDELRFTLDVSDAFNGYCFKVIMWETDSKLTSPCLYKDANNNVKLIVGGQVYTPYVFDISTNITYLFDLGVGNKRIDTKRVGISEARSADTYEWSFIIMMYKDFEITNEKKYLSTQEDVFFISNDLAIKTKKPELYSVSLNCQQPHNYSPTTGPHTYDFNCAVTFKSIRKIIDIEKDMLSFVEYDSSNQAAPLKEIPLSGVSTYVSESASSNPNTTIPKSKGFVHIKMSGKYYYDFNTRINNAYLYIDISNFFTSTFYCDLTFGQQANNIKYVSIANGALSITNSKPTNRYVTGLLIAPNWT